MHPVYVPSYLQFVVKITKFCNLRCRYCYEYPYLADPTRMSLSQLEQMFLHIAEHYQKNPNLTILDFIWHGGEPFVIKPSEYQAIYALQQQIFEPLNIEILNKVQTNLTLLDDTYIYALKNGLFDSIGVSIDLFGGDRVNRAGKCVEAKILHNMQRLADHGIQHGCITVLSRQTFEYVEKIYTFFDEIQTPCRFLPIYRTGFEGQQVDNGLESLEIVNAYQRIFETWLASEHATEVAPLSGYITTAMRVLQQETCQKVVYERRTSDTLFIVNTDGETYCTDEVYDKKASYGNLFEQPFETLLTSVGYNQAVERAQFKMAATCHQCPYWGACIGYEMAESTIEQMYFNESGQLECRVVKPIITYIKERLLEENMVEHLRFRAIID
ncbi:MAG: hypothetical protein RIS64_563 [Bacteroidota bacterium]|jgi:uncharacterized protein